MIQLIPRGQLTLFTYVRGDLRQKVKLVDMMMDINPLKKGRLDLPHRQNLLLYANKYDINLQVNRTR